MGRRIAVLLLAVVVVSALSGCGETFSGVGKDTNRIGRGVKTLLFREGSK